jgi:hypothetical protein
MVRVRVTMLLSTAVLTAACPGSGEFPVVQPDGAAAASSCWQRDASLPDGSAPGCFPRAPAQICQVPGPCQPLCRQTEYEMVCGGSATGMPARIPDPDPALGCQIIPIPTPPNVSFYCCPCGR